MRNRRRRTSTQSGTLSPLPAVNIGGVAANVTFAGLVSPGEFQFNVVVPASLANGPTDHGDLQWSVNTGRHLDNDSQLNRSPLK